MESSPSSRASCACVSPSASRRRFISSGFISRETRRNAYQVSTIIIREGIVIHHVVRPALPSKPSTFLPRHTRRIGECVKHSIPHMFAMQWVILEHLSPMIPLRSQKRNQSGGWVILQKLFTAQELGKKYSFDYRIL